MNTRKIAFGLLASMLALSACETTAGLGRDTTKLGNDVTGTAEKDKPTPSSTGN
ncbi:MAG: entericidin [Alphaproteobacteria bacterium]